MEYNINDEDLNDLISEAQYIIDNNVNTNVTKEAEGYTDDIGRKKGNVNRRFLEEILLFLVMRGKLY